MKGEGKERCAMKILQQIARQTHFLTCGRVFMLVTEQALLLRCELCLLGCYQSSVPTHSAEFKDNLFFPVWLFAVGRRTERKSSEKNTLKENGREGKPFPATLHPPS